ncbi:MAG: sulfatase [Planctomycetes bacterium]|nr:sulfatase [Planctomycetota bacterium]
MTRALAAPFLALLLFACGDRTTDDAARDPSTAQDDAVVLAPGDGLLAYAASLRRTAGPSRALPDDLAALSGSVWVRTPELRPGDWAPVQTVPPEWRAALEQLGGRLWRTRSPVAAATNGSPRVVVDGVALGGTETARAGRSGLSVSVESTSGFLLAASDAAPTGVALDVPVDAAALFPEPDAGPPVPHRVEFGDTTRRVLDLPAPGGLALAVRRLDGDALDVAVGVVDEGYRLGDGVLRRAQGVSDGVTFALDVLPRPDLERDAPGAPPPDGASVVRAWSRFVAPDEFGRFVEARVDLSRWTGRAVELRLVSDPGPGGDPAFDHAVWGDLRVRGPRRAPPARPHVVLIDVDTLRADRLGVYDGHSGLTPRLDAWARREALVVGDCTSTASWTLPSTASMLTGLAVHQHGVDRATLALSQDLPTLAARLRTAGYETRAVAGGGYLRPAFGFDAGFDVFTTVDPKDVAWSAALAGLAEKRSERPTFLFLHTYLVHAPYPHDAAFDGGYDGPLAGEDVDHPNVIDPWLAGELELDASDRAYVAAMYDALVRRMDAQVGAFLDELEQALAGDPCLVVFTSDHGEAFFEHDMLGHGAGLYAEQLRVPLLLRFPDGKPGRTERPASLLDVVPTVLDAVGLPVPPELPGRSLKRPPRGTPRVRVAEMSDGTRTVQSEGAKLFERPDADDGAGRVELYDLVDDPHERRDLSAEDPDRVAALRERLQWFLSTHPPVAGAGTGSALDDAVSDQLRALGYLGDR